MGEIGLRWTNADERFWIDGLVRIAGDADKLSTRDESDRQRIPPGGTSGYAVASLRTGWQANEALLLTLNLENLTDEAYRVHGSGQNEAGIGAIFGMRYSW